MLHPLPPIAALIIPAAISLASPPIFTTKNFEDAKKQSVAEKKLLLVDSMADWCPPCKRMDKTTWVDQKTVDWFKDNAIAFQFDVDKDEQLAKDFAIEVMPTMIIYKDGKEVDRATGYMATDELISWLEDVKKGKTKAAALAEEARKLREKASDRVGKNGKVDVRERMEIARKLARTDPALAAEEYAWLWDNMLEHQRSMYGVRLSFMVGDMQNLAKKSPEARKTFTKLRDDAETKLKNKTADGETLVDWIHLNKVINDDDRTIAWYDRVKDDPEAASDIKRNQRDLVEIFTAKKRWADLGKLYKNPEADAKAEVTQAKSMIGMAGNGEHAAEMKAYAQQSTREALATMYAALLAANRDADADKVAGVLVDFSDTAEARYALVRTALTANQPRESQRKLLDDADAKANDKDTDLRAKLTDALKN